MVDAATATSPTIAESGADTHEAFQRIPEHLRIQLLYQDADIVVIYKPPGLRSVPGNASIAATTTTTTSIGRKRKAEDHEENVTAAVLAQDPKNSSSTTFHVPEDEARQRRPQRKKPGEAWIEAIRQFSACESMDTKYPTSATSDHGNHIQGDRTVEDLMICTYLQRLAKDQNKIPSIPRKFKPFQNYIARNQKYIFRRDGKSVHVIIEDIAKQMFRMLEHRAKQLLNAPEPTADWESAAGQLKILGFASNIGTSRVHQDLFFVHRLDCATSGVMLFARTSTAAAKLSEAWRGEGSDHHDTNENETVDDTRSLSKKGRRITKIYHALVRHWDLFQIQGKTEGTIHFFMAPHPTERLKWTVVDSAAPTDHGNGSHGVGIAAKPSTTLWKVLSQHQQQQDRSQGGVLLQLQPLTGRTHQLRVHCAAMNSPIVGDSLYGNPLDYDDHKETPNEDRLYLHAYQLTFPHPTLDKEMTFSVDPRWNLERNN